MLPPLATSTTVCPARRSLICRAAASDAAVEMHRQVRASLQDRSLIVGVDRLDYSKGLEERFNGYARFLKDHAEHHRRVVLAQIAPPIGWSLDRIYELFPRLKERRKQEGVTLSGGEQQMLAIARALARDIKVLLLDEPYEGLAPVIVDEIEKTLSLIKSQGITTILVEQNAVRALKLADRAVILDTGGVVFDGTAEEVLNNAELRAEYLAI